MVPHYYERFSVIDQCSINFAFDFLNEIHSAKKGVEGARTPLFRDLLEKVFRFSSSEPAAAAAFAFFFALL